jgi:hypothetical protein
MMPAPLFARFCRRLTSDGGYLEKPSKLAYLTLLQHRMRARVFSFDDAASEEVGRVSMLPPSRLWPIYEGLRMPTTDVWIELDMAALMRGSNELDKPRNVDADPANRPVRTGFALIQRAPADDRVAFNYVQYATGKTQLSPYLAYLLDDPNETTEKLIAAREQMAIYKNLPAYGIGAGVNYTGTYRDTDKLFSKLAGRLDVVNILKPTSENAEALLVYQANGSPRWVAAALAVAMASTRKPFLVQERAEEALPRASGHTSRTVTEVTLQSPLSARAGKTDTEKVFRTFAREAIRKKAHDVIGHWSYRHGSSEAGANRLYCPDDTPHDFEKDLVSPNREACAKCGQVRWFKHEHKRGDPALGTVEKKIYNIRG